MVGLRLERMRQEKEFRLAEQLDMKFDRYETSDTTFRVYGPTPRSRPAASGVAV